MSDADLLSPQPITFGPDGEPKPWSFAPCDLDCELRFQSLHERFARNRLEAMQAGISPAAHAENLERFVALVSANKFAFGGPLSIAFLSSNAGMAEYLAMLAAKAGCRAATAARLDRFRRADQAGWERLTEAVLRRDLPNLMAPTDGRASSSEATATTPPSTTEPTSASPENPG